MKQLDKIAISLAVQQLRQKLQHRREVIRDMVERQILFETRTMPSKTETEEHVLRMRVLAKVLLKEVKKP